MWHASGATSLGQGAIVSVHIVSTNAHTAILTCEKFYQSGEIGLAFRCDHDAGHAGDCGPRESTGEIDGTPPDVAPFVSRVLIFGTSYSLKRKQVGWSDVLRMRSFIAVAQPTFVIHGASPGKGADDIADIEASAYYAALGLDPREHVLPFPVDHALDGAWPAAGHRRNARMYRDGAPSLTAGFVMGKVGSALSKGSEGMAGVIRRAGKVPLVIYRENGIEPLARADEPLEHRLAGARGEMLKLHHFAPADVKLAGVAVRAALDLARGMYDMRRAGEAVMAARSALEALRIAQPRLTPWLYGVEALLV